MNNKFIKLLKDFNNIDKSILKVMNYGFLVSLLISIIGILLLVYYKLSYISYDLIEASIILFKSGLLFTIQIFACGYIINMLKN